MPNVKEASNLSNRFGEGNVRVREIGSIRLSHVTGYIVEGIIGDIKELWVTPDDLKNLFFKNYPKQKDAEVSQKNFLSAAGVTAVCLLGDLLSREARGEAGLEERKQRYVEEFRAIFLESDEAWQTAAATGVLLDLGFSLIFEPELEARKVKLDQYAEWAKELLNGYEEAKAQAGLTILTRVKPEDYLINGEPLDMAKDALWLSKLTVQVITP